MDFSQIKKSGPNLVGLNELLVVIDSSRVLSLSYIILKMMVLEEGLKLTHLRGLRSTDLN